MNYSGYKFSCQRCLYCCSVEPGYVFLSQKDVDEISSYLKIEKNEFIAIYCRYVDYGEYYLVSLKEKDNYDCVFLSPSGCAIYPVRPLQCATYPFWPSIIKDKRSWNEEMKSCPGLGKGEEMDPNYVKECIVAQNNNQLLKIFKKSY